MNKSLILLSAVIFLSIGTLRVHGAPLKIFVSIPPQQWLVENLAGDLAASEMLLGGGQDPHTFEPTPRQIGGLSKAQLYLTIGMTFEHHISTKLGQTNSTLKIIDTSHGIKKLTEPDHSHSEHSADDHRSNSGYDPHIWLSPINLIEIARNITMALIGADGNNQDLYEEKFTKLEHRLLQLHENIKTKLAPYTGAHFFVFHPAFGYFANEYHLHQVPIEIEGKLPSPKQLFRIVSQARSQNIDVLFVQPQFDPSSAQAVAQAINGEIIILDPLARDIIANIDLMADAIADSLKNRAE